MISRDKVRACLTGPIASVRTMFSRDGSIDFDGLRSYVDFIVEAGTKTVLLTAGDSHYECLGDSEIAEVTRVTSEQTARRAMVVAADQFYSTGRAVEFAQYAKSVGAEVVMCRPPDWSQSCTPETLSDHYAAVAQQMPVMIVTNVFSSHGPAFGLETIRLALEKSDNVVAVKDDMRGAFATKLCLLAHDRCAIFAGGQKISHMNMHPYGCDGYLSTFITFKPEIAHRYWKAIEAGDLTEASAVIAEYDMPYFDFIVPLTGGFDAGIHGTLELFGIAQRWRRPPYHSLRDEEMEKLADFFKGKALL